MSKIAVYFLAIQSELSTRSSATTIKLYGEGQKLAYTYVCIGGGFFILNLISNFACRRVASGIVGHFTRRYLTSLLLVKSVGWFEDKYTGDLLDVLNVNSSKIGRGSGENISQMIINLTYCVGQLFLSILFCKSRVGWKLGAVMLGVVPLLAIVLLAMSILVKGKQLTSSSQSISFAAISNQSLTMIKTVLAFNGRQKETSAFQEAVLEDKRSSLRRNILGSLSVGLLYLIAQLFFALVFWYSSLLRYQKDFDAENIIFSFNCTLGAMLSFAPLVFQVSAFNDALAAISILEGYSQNDDLESAAPAATINHPKFESCIEFRNVSFAYPGRRDVQILSNFSITIAKGKFVALVGLSGSGKSTIMQLLLRIFKPDSGQILLDGIDIQTMDLLNYRNLFGVVGQEPVLFKTSIRQNVSFAVSDKVDDEKIWKALKIANAATFVSELSGQLDYDVGEKGSLLSGGQKQRIAIARAVIKNPKILCLDEATSALDAESEKHVQESMHMMGITILSIAHRLSTIRRADCIHVLGNGGQILESGKYDELISNREGIFSAMTLKQQEENSELVPPTLKQSLPSPMKLSPFLPSPMKLSPFLSSPMKPSHPSPIPTNLSPILPSPMSLEVHSSQNSSPKKMSRTLPPLVRIRDHLAEKKKQPEINSYRNSGIFWTFIPTVLPSPIITDSIVDDKDDLMMGRELSLSATMKSLFSQGKSFQWRLWVGSVLASVLASPYIAYGYIFGSLIASIFTETDIDKVKKNGEDFAKLQMISGSVSFFIASASNYLLGSYGIPIIAKVRVLLFRNFLDRKVSWFEDGSGYDTAVLCSILSSGVSCMKTLVDHSLCQMVLTLAHVLGAIITASFFNVKIAFLCLGWKSVFFICLSLDNLYKRRASESSKVVTEWSIFLSNEVIKEQKTIRYLGLERQMLDRYGTALDTRRRLERPYILRSSLFYSMAASVFVFFNSTAYWLGLYLMKMENITYRDLVLSIIIVYTLDTGLRSLLEVISNIGGSVQEASRVFRLLGQDSSPSEKTANSGETLQMTGFVSFENVSFAYPSNPTAPILRGISFKVSPGKTVALVGSSGSGKSTIVSLLLGFYQANSGTIRLDPDSKNDFNCYDVDQIRSQISIVSQEPDLFPRSIRENIAYGVQEATMQEIIAAAKAANIHEYIESLPEKYETFVGERGAQLSGGEKQRISIARAIIRNPKILLLDEATSALDVESEAIVQNALNQISKGRSTIVIAHRLSTVINAHEILVMDKGIIVERGSHDQLLLNPTGLYTRLWQLDSANKMK